MIRKKSGNVQVLYRGDSLPCMACAVLVNIGINYPSQPTNRSLELWCPNCKTISVWGFSMRIYLIGGVSAVN